MGIFGSIMNKIFHSGTQAAAAPAQQQAQAAPAEAQGDTAVAEAPAQQSVDVGAVLSEMAATKGGGGNYQSSIVDLLKLLDLDSSLTARTAAPRRISPFTARSWTSSPKMAAWCRTASGTERAK